MVDMRTWLAEHGFDQLQDLFEENEVDGEVLFELNNDDLKDLGLSLGLRKKFLKALANSTSGSNQSASENTVKTSAIGERRQVTVLFADLAGFTQLSTNLDPEDTHRLLNRYFSVVDGIIESHGGKVDKHLGDGVMAVFGAPVAHSDDPLRALRAASDIHDAMPKLGKQFGRTLKTHIGIASGVVVASRTGSAQHTEYTVTGDTVNLASRLDDLAEPGETLVSQAVYQVLMRHAEFSSRGTASIKGLQDPIPTWSFVRLLDDADVHWATEFVGRTSELRQFGSIVEDMFSENAGQTLLLRGEPGIGKTRLAFEFTNIAERSKLKTHRVTIVDFGINRGAQTLHDLTATLLDMPSNPTSDDRIDARNRALGQGLVDAENEIFLYDLLNIEHPEQLRTAYKALDNQSRNEGIGSTLSTMVIRLALDTPRLIVIEDIHWADPLTLDILASVALGLPNCPAILLLTSRIEGRTLDQDWLTSLRGCPLTIIELQPLQKQYAIQLAKGLSTNDRSKMEELLERADGNPLFIEQLLSDWTPDNHETLPDTIQGFVLARADRLPAEDREALFAASALGQRFSLDLLKELINDSSYDCNLLTKHRLLRIEGEEHVFCHALIRDGLYASMVGERRRELHTKAADIYAARNLILHAQHLDLAGSDEASAAYLAAAQDETERIHYDAAVQLLQRGIELGANSEIYEMYMLLGELQRRLGNISEAIEAYRCACDDTSDNEKACQAMIGIAEGLRIHEAYTELLDTLEKATQKIEHLDLPKERARICQLKSSVHFVHGDTQSCIAEGNRSLEYARAAGSRELEAQALDNLADAEFSRGRMITAHKLFDDCVKLAEKFDVHGVTAANLSMRGQTLLYLGQPREALTDCQNALGIAKRQFDPRAEMVSRIVGLYVLELFDTQAAREWAKAGQDLAKQLGAERFETVCIEYLGRVAAIDGDVENGERLALEALERYRQAQSAMRFLGGRALGSYALVCRDPNKRIASLQEGEEILTQGVGGHNHLWFYRDAIEVSLELNDWDEAERYSKCLEDYSSVEPLRWSSYFAKRGRALAEHGRGKDVAQLLKSAHADGEDLGFAYSLRKISAAF